MIRIKRGLNLPIAGSPRQTAHDGRQVSSVALLGADYPGLKPTMEVTAGDRVTAGQLLFTDKKNPGIKFTSPATGTVSAINRGARRAFQSVVIDIHDGEETTFQGFEPRDVKQLSRDVVVSQLIDSGEWTAFRTRPYSRVPAPDAVPAAIFVTAIDTRPLAPDPNVFISLHKDAFATGLQVLTRLTEGVIHVCKAVGATLPQVDDNRIQEQEFAGPHPAGLVGTHIHFLAPVSQHRSVWHIGYQNLIAIGYLFQTGNLFHDRLIALAGPGVESPRLVTTRAGACLLELTAGELLQGNQRIVSGSVLDGRTAAGPTAYLHRFHNQVSVLAEGTERQLLGFVMPGTDKFSVTRLFASAFMTKRQFAMTTSTGGSERAMVPMGSYEAVMPLDILPTQLLRALLVEDVDTSIALGCLELDEEDLALCTMVCPGKYEYGPYLRQMLSRIEAEG